GYLRRARWHGHRRGRRRMTAGPRPRQRRGPYAALAREIPRRRSSRDLAVRDHTIRDLHRRHAAAQSPGARDEIGVRHTGSSMPLYVMHQIVIVILNPVRIGTLRAAGGVGTIE